MYPFECTLSRRRFLQVSAAAGVVSTVIPALSLPEVPARKTASPGSYHPGPTTVTKSVCHQCPARCGIDVHTTAAAADRALLVKPGTDGALALAIAHVLLTEGLWDRFLHRLFGARSVCDINHELGLACVAKMDSYAIAGGPICP